MAKKILVSIFLLLYSIGISQSSRDEYILERIESDISNLNLSKERYFEIKAAIEKLEKENGYQPDFKYRLLDKSFVFNDIDFFMQELSILVENYGFNIAYTTGSESYFKAITTGELKEWFKEMYLIRHFKWLVNNFDKQFDLRKLNELRMKDQLINSFAAKITHTVKLDSVQKNLQLKHLNDFYYSNIMDLFHIMQKWSVYPTGKSFALVQNNFGVVEFHNNQVRENFDRFWPLFYPYYKKAYLNDEITYMPFRNHDNFSFLHYGFQEFGLISIKNIPLEHRKDDNEIPIKNLDFMLEIRKELKWK